MSFLRPSLHDGKERCRVCGNYSLERKKISTLRLRYAGIGALLMYAVLDIAHDGKLNGSILYVVLQAQQILVQAFARIHG